MDKELHKKCLEKVLTLPRNTTCRLWNFLSLVLFTRAGVTCINDTLLKTTKRGNYCVSLFSCKHALNNLIAKELKINMSF